MILESMEYSTLEMEPSTMVRTRKIISNMSILTTISMAGPSSGLATLIFFSKPIMTQRTMTMGNNKIAAETTDSMIGSCLVRTYLAFKFQTSYM